MNLLSVTHDPAGASCILNIDINEIIMLRYSRTHDKIEVHTARDVYFTVGTLKYWCDVLNFSGLEFASVDRSNVLNLKKVKVLDETFKVAYFETEINSKSKKCLIAEYKFNDVKERLGQLNPLLVLT